MLLTACNLFIDEEFEEEYPDVRVHTGYGYDSPVHDSASYYDLTYQFNDNVLYLSPEIQSYIYVARFDSTGTIGCIDFDVLTPKDFLPNNGEYVVCGNSLKFPNGIAHQVMAGAEVDGVYRIITCSAELKDIFKVLDMDIDVNQYLSERYPELTRQTRIGEENTVEVREFQKKVHYQGNYDFDGVTLIDVDKKGRRPAFTLTGEGNINFEAADNWTDHKMKFHLRTVDVGFADLPYSFYITDDYKFHGDINLSGSLNGNITLFESTDVLPAACGFGIPETAPIVFLKICLGVNVSINFGITAEQNIKFNIEGRSQTTLTNINYLTNPLKCIEDFAKDVKEWKLYRDKNYLSVSEGYSGSAGLELLATPGIGLYSEKLSARMLIGGQYNASASSLKVTSGTGFSGLRHWTFENNEGIDLWPNLGMGIEFHHPQKVKTVLKDFLGSMGNAQLLVSTIYATIFLEGDEQVEYLEQAKEIADFIKTAAGDISEIDDNSVSNSFGPWWAKDDPDDDGSKTFGNEELVKFLDGFSARWTWLPKTEGFGFTKGFQITDGPVDDPDNPSAATTTGKVLKELELRFDIKKRGIFVNQFERTLTPCVVITTENNTFRQIIFTGDMKNVVKPGQGEERTKFKFKVANLPLNRSYKAYFGYYNGMVSDIPSDVLKKIKNGQKDDIWKEFYFDKGEMFNTRMPSVRFTEIRHVKTTKLSNDKVYEAEREFVVSCKVSDVTAVKEYGIYRPSGDKYFKGKDINSTNGRFDMTYKQTVWRDVNNNANNEELIIEPYIKVQVDDKESPIILTGPQYYLPHYDGTTVLFDENGEPYKTVY